MSLISDGISGWLSEEEEADGQTGAQQKATSTTGGSSSQEPVVVWEAANPMEAQIVKGRLESEGIPAFVRGEALGKIYGLTSGRLAATDVLVPAPLAEKALEILQTEAVWLEDEELAETVRGDSEGTSDKTNEENE